MSNKKVSLPVTIDMTKGVFLLLGSNQGNPQSRLDEAIKRIEETAGQILQASAVYRTEAWGLMDQPDFYNQVIRIETSHSSQSLLKEILAIEQSMGRVRLQKWGPRIIDIDLLFYDQEIIDVPGLRLPHPGIPERKFTLLPLFELAPDFIHPVTGKRIRTLLKECADPLRVEKVDLSKSPERDSET